MNAQQLNHYRSLKSINARADYLVRIGEAPNFSEAMSQISKRAAAIRAARKARGFQTPAPAPMGRVAMAYFD